MKLSSTASRRMAVLWRCEEHTLVRRCSDSRGPFAPSASNGLRPMATRPPMDSTTCCGACFRTVWLVEDITSTRWRRLRQLENFLQRPPPYPQQTAVSTTKELSRAPQKWATSSSRVMPPRLRNCFLSRTEELLVCTFWNRCRIGPKILMLSAPGVKEFVDLTRTELEWRAEESCRRLFLNIYSKANPTTYFAAFHSVCARIKRLIWTETQFAEHISCMLPNSIIYRYLFALHYYVSFC